MQARSAWGAMFPGEPFDLPVGEPDQAAMTKEAAVTKQAAMTKQATQFTRKSSYDIATAMRRQSAFLYQASAAVTLSLFTLAFAS